MRTMVIFVFSFEQRDFTLLISATLYRKKHERTHAKIREGISAWTKTKRVRELACRALRALCHQRHPSPLEALVADGGVLVQLQPPQCHRLHTVQGALRGRWSQLLSLCPTSSMPRRPSHCKSSRRSTSNSLRCSNRTSYMLNTT